MHGTRIKKSVFLIHILKMSTLQFHCAPHFINPFPVNLFVLDFNAWRYSEEN
jgi:hypothetical protein